MDLPNKQKGLGRTERKADLMKKSKSSKSRSKRAKRSQIIDQIPKRRIWLFRFIALIVIPIVFFSLFELTLRIFHFGYPTTALVETSINGTNYIRDNSDFAYRFFPKKLAQEFVPIQFEFGASNTPNPKQRGTFECFIYVPFRHLAMLRPRR